MDAPSPPSASGTDTEAAMLSDVAPHNNPAEVAALLSFNADVLYPRVGADVASMSSFVEIVTALQLRCEGDSSFRDVALGSANAARVLDALALWLATWPGADNVVAAVAICAYLVSLAPGGCEAASRAAMRPVDKADADRRRVAVADRRRDGSEQSFILRLAFASHGVSGSESPANSMIAAARCSSFLSNVLNHSVSTDDFELFTTLQSPIILSFLCATVATFADRPHPDVFCGPRAAKEARATLESSVDAGISLRGQCIVDGVSRDRSEFTDVDAHLERAFVALFKIPLAVCGAIDTRAFTPGGAAALAEIVRNTVAKIIPLVTPYFALSVDLHVDESFFFALGETASRPVVVISRLISTLFSALVRCSWMSALARPVDHLDNGAPQYAPAVHAGLIEHLLAACFNMSTCPQLRDALCFSAPGYAGDLRQLLRCGLNGISRFNSITPAGTPYAAPIASAMCIIMKVLVIPLTESPMIASALSAHFADAGGFGALAALIENRAGASTDDATSRDVVLAAVAVAHAHLRAPGAVRAERGTIVSLCDALVRYLEHTFITRRRAPNEAEIVALGALASRVSYMPPTAFGAFPLTIPASGGEVGRGDDPATWPAAAQALVRKIDEAMTPDTGTMAAAA